LDCSQYKNDREILAQFPFTVKINPIGLEWTPTASTAYMDPSDTLVKSLTLKAVGNIVPESIFCLRYLTSLMIENMTFVNGIVPDSLANLQQLSYLGIQNIPITQMTDKVTYLHSLNTLSLRNCALTQMPNLRYMPNLSSLFLPQNKLTRLDGLMYVYHLWISDNLFTELPTQLVPERLHYLMMNNNPLNDVTKLTSFFNLTHIEFSHTDISSLPTDIDKLSNLYSLDLSYSKLQYLPDNVLNLSNLNKLNIQNNLFSAEEIKKIKAQFGTNKSNVALTV